MSAGTVAAATAFDLSQNWEYEIARSSTAPASGWHRLDELDRRQLRNGAGIWLRHILPGIGTGDADLVFEGFAPRLRVFVGDALVYDYNNTSGHYSDVLTIHEVHLPAGYAGKYLAIAVPHVPFESLGIERPFVATPGSVPPIVHEIVNAPLRRELPYLVIGILAFAFGAAALTLFMLRRRAVDIGVAYLGLFSVLYGARLLIETRFIQLAIGEPGYFWRWPESFITNVIAIPVALLIRRAMGPGWKSSLNVAVGIVVVCAAAALGSDLVRGTPLSFDQINAAATMIVIAIVLGNMIVTPVRRTAGVRALTAGFLVFTAVALNSNVGAFGLHTWRPSGLDIEPYGLLVLLIAFIYFSAQQSFAKEEKLTAIEHELETARVIQQSILPRQVPSISTLDIAARYVPMTAVAGDFYDFIQVDGNRLGVLVADVSGHGVPAALVASMVKIAFAGQKEHASDPARVLAGMNEVLNGRVQKQFVTALYAFIDAPSRSIVYASAGHPPPFVWHAATKSIDSLKPGGFALGPFRKASYANSRIALEPGDRLIFYTDGITEAANGAREFYGDHGLLEFIQRHCDLSAEQFTNKLIDDVGLWSRAQDDDLTVVAVHFAR